MSVSLKPLSEQVIVITGASSGIGTEAEQYPVATAAAVVPGAMTVLSLLARKRP